MVDVKVKVTYIVTEKYWDMNVPNHHMPKTKKERDEFLRTFHEGTEGIELREINISEIH